MKTPIVLMVVHVIAFTLMLLGHVAPGPVMNGIVAIGLTVEFPGWFLAAQFLHSAVAALVFTFFFNAGLYYTGGLLIDLGTRRRAA